MYTLMSDKQKEKFRMLSIGTPANNVAGGGPYVTLYGDFVIRPIPDSLPANTNGGGHSFVGAYLAKIDSRIKIAPYIKNAYDNLMQTTSCTEYKFIKVLMQSFGQLRIVGRPTDQVSGEKFITEIDLEQRDAKFDENTNKWHCGGQTTLYSNNSGAGGINWSYWNYTDEFGEEHSGNFEWNPARLHNNNELEERASIKEDVLLDLIKNLGA